ncbi:immunoglobulin-like domain-containing protein [Enterococcus sp. 5H]|uniref:immunoglobulin-like domain-containing protein n=1 Tax=Enterococcus sp. 5H TaxID=1229490 RepID=UPI0023046905|nr:immunoglobulin-like domain-containing protein [Enterococcus sp. 5H]MDA9470514.1 Chitinase [Enterococcus sp. 5H]
MNISIKKIFTSASLVLLMGCFLLGGIGSVSAEENAQVSENGNQIEIDHTVKGALDNKFQDVNFLKNNPPTIVVDTTRFWAGETVKWRHIRNGKVLREGVESISKVWAADLSAKGMARISFNENYFFAIGDKIELDLLNAFKRIVDSFELKMDSAVNPAEPQLNGVYDATINLGDSFDPMSGVTARGALGENITNLVIVKGTVNTNIPGTYTLSYSVTDPLTNLTISKERTILVQATKPELNGVYDTTINLGDSFDPMYGVTARGALGEDITNLVIVSGTVNTNIPGTYTLSYSVTDPLTNLTISKERTILVQATEPELNGVYDTIINLGDSFDPMSGVTARGALGEDITNLVIVSGTVNTNISGMYTLSYTVTDPLTNLTISKERNILVQPAM